MGPDFGRHLKESKVIQWLLAYFAGAWLVLQVVDVLSDQFYWSVGFQRAVTVVLAIGATVTVVVAWYHGEEGPQRVKGTEIAVLGVILALGGFGVNRLSSESGGLTSAPLVGETVSLAVLPFEHRSGDEGDEYFTDGIHDEVLTRVYNLSGIRVVSRTSVEAYRDSDKTVPEIAGELGVTYVLEGAVQRAGGRVRISAQLLDGLRDEHVWAQTFDRPTTVRNLLDVQTEIATAIAVARNVALAGETQGAPEPQPTQSMQAYEAYVRAVAIGADGILANQLEAIELYEEAVAADPGFARAWAALSRIRMAVYFQNVGFRNFLGLAFDALERAEALAPDADFTHIARASYAFRGEIAYEEALRHLDAVRGSDPVAMGYRALILWRMGRWSEALPIYFERLLLDPRNPTAHQDVGRRLVELRRYEEAIPYIEGARALAPNRAAPRQFAFAARLGATGDTVGMVQWAAELEHPRISAWVAYIRRDFSAARTLAPPPLGSDFIYWTQWYPALLIGEEVRLAYADSLRTGGSDRLADVYSGRGPPDRFLEADGHIALGYSAALRGDADEAIAEATQAIETIPISLDAIFGAWVQRAAMNLLIIVDERERALDLLEELMDIPSDLSVGWLRFDPFFDSIRDHPRFRRLVGP